MFGGPGLTWSNSERIAVVSDEYKFSNYTYRGHDSVIGTIN